MSPKRAVPLVLCALGIGAALLPAGASARPRLSCGSGHTELKDGQTRLFRTNAAWYLCSSQLKRPRLVLSAVRHGGPFQPSARLGHRLLVVRQSGNRVVFAFSELAGLERSWWIGWVDVTTGAERDTELSSAGGDTSVPFARPQALAVAADGSVAFVTRGDDVGWAPDPTGTLGPPSVLATGQGAIASSLSFANGAVCWTNGAGAQSCAPTG